MHAKQEDDLPRRDSLLQELRDLTAGNPNDAAVRERLVKSLAVRWMDSLEEGRIELRETLRAGLQALRGQYPDDSVWGWLAENISKLEIRY